MKVLKYLGLGLLTLAVIYLVWAIASPSTMDISKSIEINKDPATVFNAVRDFNLYGEWNPWSRMDTAAKNDISGSGREIGDAWNWEGKEIGKGSLTHLSFNENEKLSNRLELKGPMFMVADENWTFEKVGGHTKVTWHDKSSDQIPFLYRPIFPMMMNSQFEAGLKNLKEMVEAMPDTPVQTAQANKVSVQDTPDMYYLGIADSCEVSKIGERLGTDYSELQDYFKKNKIETTGAPMAIYSYYDGKTTSFIAAFPVKGPEKAGGKIISGKISAGKSIVAMHLGPYEKSGETHEAIDAFAKANKMKTDKAIEVYENDPALVKPEEIKTRVIYPVAG